MENDHESPLDDQAGDIAESRWGMDFDVSKSIRYHSLRRSFWEQADFWSKMITIMSGSAVLATVSAGRHGWAQALAILVAVASAMDLVLGFSQRARVHDGLLRSFSKLLQDIAASPSPTNDVLWEWKRRRLEIEMDEPGVVDLLERRCAGEEAIARGCPLRAEWQLNTWQLLLSQFAFWPGFHQGPPKAC